MICNNCSFLEEYATGFSRKSFSCSAGNKDHKAILPAISLDIPEEDFDHLRDSYPLKVLLVTGVVLPIEGRQWLVQHSAHVNLL
jgi:hypothetical protein